MKTSSASAARSAWARAWGLWALIGLGACTQPAPPALPSSAAVTALNPTVVDAAAARRGARLFTGEAPLVASLRGHDQALPLDALRCSNCHVVGTGSSPPALPVAAVPTGLAADLGPRGVVATPVAPRLGPQTLLQPQRRRGGPPSQYGVDSFCKLLRTGVDPAQVYAAHSMPVYRISDADCTAIWSHLMSTGTR